MAEHTHGSGPEKWKKGAKAKGGFHRKKKLKVPDRIPSFFFEGMLMRRWDVDDSDLAIAGGVVVITALILLKGNAKDLAMAYLTGIFGIGG